MHDPYPIALAASVLAALVTTLGIACIRFFEPWARANSIYFVSFAAGILIAVALLHLIPESQELAGRRASVCVLAGYLALYVFNRVRRIDGRSQEVRAIGPEEVDRWISSLWLLSWL